MIPDPEKRRKKVFVGGHSYGGLAASMFAGWDLDGDPETLDDAGYMNCAGLFAFDTSVKSASDVLAPFISMLPISMFNLIDNMTEEGYKLFVKSLQKNIFPNIAPMPFFTPEVHGVI